MQLFVTCFDGESSLRQSSRGELEMHLQRVLHAVRKAKRFAARWLQPFFLRCRTMAWNWSKCNSSMKSRNTTHQSPGICPPWRATSPGQGKELSSNGRYMDGGVGGGTGEMMSVGPFFGNNDTSLPFYEPRMTLRHHQEGRKFLDGEKGAF